MARAQSSRFSEVFDSVQLAETSTLAPSKPVPRVRIHFPPPHRLKCRENSLDSSKKCEKWAQFRIFYVQTGPEKVSCSLLLASFAAFFSGGHTSSPVSTTRSGECNAITNRS